jgi:hypothetical protein
VTNGDRSEVPGEAFGPNRVIGRHERAARQGGIVVIGLLGAVLVSVRPRTSKVTAPRDRRGIADRVRLADRRYDGVSGVGARTSDPFARLPA